MLEATIKALRDKRGVSNVIVVMLSLVLIVIIVANLVLLSYQMNQFDWERAQEKIEIIDVQGQNFTFGNDGPLTVRIISLWIVNSTDHEHYDLDLFINSRQLNMPTNRYNTSISEFPYQDCHRKRKFCSLH